MDMFRPDLNPRNTSPDAALLRRQNLDLRALMRLAVQFHLGGNSGSPANMRQVLELIRERAADELEIGDGVKLETVRVERKLDGTVSIFFGF